MKQMEVAELKPVAAGSSTVQVNGPYMAELQSVEKRYGKTVALAGLDLQVRRGELLAVLGPNGAGKSTAIALMLGLQQPDKGVVKLLGQSPLKIETRRHVGVMMQEVFLAGELKVKELLDLVSSYYPDPFTPRQAMEFTNTLSLADRPYGKLSGGQKRQAQFAIAVCGRPQVMFLDEPTVGLDVQARELMWTTLRHLVRGGASIVLTTHYLEEAEALADRVVVLAKGKTIASGTVSEMRNLVNRKRIHCYTAIPAEQIRSWPGVSSVQVEQDRLQIIASNAEGVARRILTTDDGVRDLEIHRAGLAEVFTELTQESAS